MKHIFSLLIFSLLGLMTFSQPHKNWLNHACSERVTDIHVNGNELWISTIGGLVKYNKETGKKEFINRANYNLPDNYLLSTMRSSDGSIWMTGRYYGIGKLKNGECTIYNTSNSSLPHDQWNMKILEDGEGNIWISSFWWMVKFDGTNWKSWDVGNPISEFPAITSFDIDKDGVVWLFSTHGIGKIENDEYTTVSTIGCFTSARNSFVKVDNNNHVWVAIENEGIYKYTGREFVNYNTENSCLPTNTFTSISFDNENNAWLSSFIGLIKFNTNNCELFTPNGNEKEQALMTVKYVNDNEVWCGAVNGKLLKFNGEGFTSIELSNSPLKSNNTSDIYASSQNVWVGTQENIVTCKTDKLTHSSNIKNTYFTEDENGNLWIVSNEDNTRLLRVNGSDTIVYDSTNSPIIPQIIFSDITANPNGLWIATLTHGLFKFSNAVFTNYTQSNSDLPYDNISCLSTDKQNNLWIGTKRGLVKFSDENWQHWDTANSNIPTNWANTIAIDDENNVWFACRDEGGIMGIEYGGGLTKFDGTNMQTYNISNSGLLSNTIFNVINDGNTLWLATCGAGLMSFDKANAWENYNVLNSGIAHNIVSNLCSDNFGNIWMGHHITFSGVSVFNPDSVIQTVGIVDIETTKGSSNIKIYPNPVKGELSVKLTLQNEEIIEAGIYNLKGSLVQTVPKQYLTNSYFVKVELTPDLTGNQILILSLKTNKGNVLNEKFLYIK